MHGTAATGSLEGRGRLLSALGALLGALRPLLGRSWSALGRSWGALWVLLGILRPLLERSWLLWGAQRREMRHSRATGFLLPPKTLISRAPALTLCARLPRI